MTNTKPIQLRPGDRRTRAVMRDAHAHGRHGRHGDGSKPDVLVYWAGICADCNAEHYYEVSTDGRRTIGLG